MCKGNITMKGQLVPMKYDLLPSVRGIAAHTVIRYTVVGTLGGHCG